MLIIEILSPGNRKATCDNARAYATLTCLQEIAVVHSERLLIEVHRRDAAGAWLPDPEMVEPKAALRLASIGFECDIVDVYADTWLLDDDSMPQAG